MIMYMKLFDFQPSKRRFTEQGYMIVPAKLARIGIMEYDGSEIGLVAGQTYRVNRYEEDVFDPAAIASFEGMPFTYIHPGEDVDAENWRDHVKGYIKNVRREGDYLVADVWVCDAATIKVIIDQKIEELSCGYASNLEPDTVADFKQTHIRGNHVALVPRGRAGSECRLGDSKRETMPKSKMSFVDMLFTALGIKLDDQQKAIAELAIKTHDSSEEESESEGSQESEKQVDSEAEPAENKDEDPQAIIAELQAKNVELAKKVESLVAEQEAKEEAQVVANDAMKLVPSITITAKDSARTIREKAIDAKGIETRANMKSMKDSEIDAIYMGMKYHKDSGIGRAMLSDSKNEPKKINYNDTYRNKK